MFDQLAGTINRFMIRSGDLLSSSEKKRAFAPWFIYSAISHRTGANES